MKNFTYLFKKLANTPPVEFKGASRRNCTTNFSWIALVLPLWQSRSDSVSIVSRQSVLAILLMLLTLFVGVGQVWGDTGTLVSALNGISSGDTYYITALYSSKYYTVPNTTISGQTFTCTEGSYNSTTTKITPATGAGEFVFTAVSNVSNAYYIYNTNLKKYLVATGEKTFGYVESTSSDYGYWTFSDVTSGGFSGVFSVTHNNKTHYMRAYNNEVKCYNGASNNGVYLFQKAASKTLSSIAVKTAPTKTVYLEGEIFAPAGLVITATYSDASTEDISYAGNTNKFSFSPATNAALTTSNTSVTVTYGEKNCSQSINVYSVTVNVVDESGNALSGEGMPTASATGKNITASASGNNYVFKQWEAVTAAGTSFAASGDASTMLNGTPTGNVTIKAVYHKPISVTWKVNNGNWNDKGGTETVAYNTAWSSLTLPTAPVPNEDGCGNKFMGWTTTNIGAVGLTEEEDISALVIMDSSNKSGLSTKITENITFYAVFADYGE